jgi:hypothetical protein
MSTLTEAEVVEEVRGFSETDREHLRDVARKDLYFLAKGILGYKDVEKGAHGGFCRFIQASEKKRRLGLMPRAHLKSTLATVADSVRLALDDPEDARILIAGETSTLAEKFLSEIKGHFEKNDLLRSLFPELAPTRFAGQGVQWSSLMATLPRRSAHKEPTWQAIGVGGASVGSHFTRIKCDDLIGFEALRSPATMAYTKAWVDNIEPLLVNQHTDIIDFIGTRWSKTDLYAHVMEGYGGSLGVYTRGAIEGGQIIFPALHSWEEYERIQRINPAQWFAQYENNPIAAGKSDFPAETIQSFRFNLAEDEVTTQKGKKWRLEQLDIVLTADPNSGSLVAPDAAAISVQGLSPDDEVFVLESWSGRVSPSAFVDEIYKKARKWSVRIVGIEKAGQQNTDHYFQLKMEREGTYFKIVPLTPRGRAKEDRVRAALEPIIRSHLLFMLPSQTTLKQQLAEFPDTILWDEVDALAYGPEVWRKPVSLEVQERRGGLTKKLMAMRNSITGY